MIAPLKTMTVTGAFGEPAVPGTGLPDSLGVKRHIGVDLRAAVGTPIYAPDAGVVTLVDNVGLKLVEIRINGMLHRFLHLDRNVLSNGQGVSRGQVIGYSGNTGGVAAHLHWDVRKNGTAYNASYYNYVNPMTLINEQGGSEIMDTDAKVKAQYYTLRGSEGTAAERKGWIGKSYEEFNAKARAEVDSREAHRRNLESAVSVLTKERDQARTEVAKLTSEVLALRDQLKVAQASNAQKDAEIQGLQSSLKEIEAQKQVQIDQLNDVIKLKDEEIARLNKELANCDTGTMTWSEHLVLGIKGLLSALNPIKRS